MSRLPSSLGFSSRASAAKILVMAIGTTMSLSVPIAWAGPGYQLDSPPSISLDAEIPTGVAVDQASQRIYVAELSKGLIPRLLPGEIEQLSATGVPTSNSPFTTGGQDFFSAVAVDPTTEGVYAYQSEASTPLGQKGTPKLSPFSSSGVLGTSFSPADSGAEALAVDSSGRIFFPNTAAGSVQIFSSSGAVEGTISCAGCPAGGFEEPTAVAFDSAGKLYVVDRGGDRVVKLAPSGGTFTYESTLQSGAGAVAVAVDTSDDDVFVGDLVGSKYHVVAYDSAGTEFDDFAAGLVSTSLVESATGQLAVNATTHRVYLSDPGGGQLWIFKRIASIPAPTVSIASASPVGQVEATLRATVNPKGHVLTNCHFEYTNHADFQANGYANAKSVPCPPVLGGPENTPISVVAKGLSTSTSYDFRILIASHGGSAEDGDQAFETLPPLPPEATTGAASAITQTTATLAGTVNPRGGPISNCHFEYTSEAAFQASGFTGAVSKICSPTPSGTTGVAVSAKITGLTVGGSYRFRVVATNNSGTTNAVEKTFAALADTCQTNPASCAPPPVAGTTLPPVQPPSFTPPPTTPIKKPLKCRKGFKKKRVHGKAKCVKIKKTQHKR